MGGKKNSFRLFKKLYIRKLKNALLYIVATANLFLFRCLEFHNVLSSVKFEVVITMT